jgi:hypothetical protein
MCQDENIQQRLGEEWPEWKKHKRYYPDVLQWWERCVKKQIGPFFRRITAEPNAEFREMENYHYICMYDVIRSDTPEERKLLVLKQYKARTVRLNSQRSNRVVMDTATNDKMKGEEPTLFHLIKTSRRHTMREIRQIHNTSGRIVTTQDEIANTLVDYFWRKYRPIVIDVASMEALINAIPPV